MTLGRFLPCLGLAMLFGAAVRGDNAWRYVVPAGPDGRRTNKVSHLGFDLMRAQVVTETLVQGVKYAVRRDRPTGECCAFPSGHAASAFALAAVLSALGSGF